MNVVSVIGTLDVIKYRQLHLIWGQFYDAHPRLEVGANQLAIQFENLIPRQ